MRRWIFVLVVACLVFIKVLGFIPVAIVLVVLAVVFFGLIYVPGEGMGDLELPPSGKRHARPTPPCEDARPRAQSANDPPANPPA